MTTGSGRATPLPVRAMTSGPLVASELMVSVAGRAPRALGVSVTVNVQVPPGVDTGVPRMQLPVTA